MVRYIQVTCPRCKQRKSVPQTSSEVECDCHLYCAEGSKPRDCSVSVVNWSGQLGWPAGAHQKQAQEGDDIRHRRRYCSIHDLYIYKTAIWMESDTSFYRTRLKKKYTVFPNR